MTRVYPWANREIQWNSWVPPFKMGLGYWKVYNIYLLVCKACTCHKNMIFMSKHILWRSGNSMDTFSKLYLWRPSWNPRWPSWTFWFYLSLKKISLESFQLWSGNKCIESKCDQNHLRINSVDGKHNVLSINHISSDLEGHQVQERNFQFGTFS